MLQSSESWKIEMINLPTPQPISVVENGKWFPWIRGGKFIFHFIPSKIVINLLYFCQKKRRKKKGLRTVHLSFHSYLSKQMYVLKKKKQL